VAKNPRIDRDRFDELGVLVWEREWRVGSIFERRDVLGSRCSRFGRVSAGSRPVIGLPGGKGVPWLNLTFEHKTSDLLANIDREVNLEALIISIELERAEYEPEQFPGLVFRPGVVDATLLVFFTGKIIIDGTSDSEEALRGVPQVEAALV
jgi:hypothetical protein